MTLVHGRAVPTNGSRVDEPSAPTTESPARSGSGVRRWVTGGGADPVVVGLVALVVYALHGYQGTLDRDLGVFMYGGIHVTQGVPPYVGIFNSVGPLADAIPALAIWLGHQVGIAPILSARLFFTLLSAIAVALLTVLARDALGSRIGALLTAAVFLTFEDFLRLASDGPREKTAMVVFMLVALIAISRRRWFMAGFFTAVGTLTWQPVLIVVVTVFLVSLLGRPGRWQKAVLRFVAGGAVPLGIAVAYFAAHHALTTAVNGFALVNVLYTTQPSIFTAPGTFWSLMWADYHASVIVFVAGLVSAIGLGIRNAPHVVRRRGRPFATPQEVLLAAIGAGAVIGTLWTLGAINGPPDLFVLLPFAALGIASAVLRMAGLFTPGRRRALLVGLVVAATVSAGVESVAGRTNRLVVQRADVQAVLRAAPAGATVLSVDAPMVLVLAGLDNPTPYQIFDPGMQGWLDHRYPGGEAGYRRHVNHLKPTFIVIGSAFGGTWPYGLLHHHYWRVGRGPTWTWYVRRSVGPVEMTRLLHVNRRVMLKYGATVGSINPAGRALRRLAESRHARPAGSRGID